MTKTQRFLKRYKYDSVDEMSILHLSMLAGELGIDSDGLSEKHFDAYADELTRAIKEVTGCSLCAGTGEALNRPSRLMGATYLDGDSGDERLEPCPICFGDKGDLTRDETDKETGATI